MENIDSLDESQLNDKLNAQIQETLQTENDLAILVKQRDQSKQKAEQIQRLKGGNKCALTETIKKLVEANTLLNSQIVAISEQIRQSTEADPQKSFRELHLSMDEIRSQNSNLHLERKAKEVVYDYLAGKMRPHRRQLKILSGEEIGNEKDLQNILSKLDQSSKTRGKHWTGLYSVAAITKTSNQ